MAEKNTAKWDFQKDGKPFDELPSVVKRNPKFLYEYIRTGELPNLDLIEDLMKNYKKEAITIIEESKGAFSQWKSLFDFRADEDDHENVNVFDKYFDKLIESGYFNILIGFEQIYYERPYNPEEDPLSLKKVKNEVIHVQKMNKIYFSSRNTENYYTMMLWFKIQLHLAENMLKELEEYELL